MNHGVEVSETAEGFRQARQIVFEGHIAVNRFLGTHCFGEVFNREALPLALVRQEQTRAFPSIGFRYRVCEAPFIGNSEDKGRLPLKEIRHEVLILPRLAGETYEWAKILKTHMLAQPTIPAAGMVRIHAQRMSAATPQRTAFRRWIDPTPAMAPAVT